MAEHPSRQRNPTIKLTDENQSHPPILSSHRENLASHASCCQEEELANASSTLSITNNANTSANKQVSANQSDPGALLLPGASSKKTGSQEQGRNSSRKNDDIDLDNSLSNDKPPMTGKQLEVNTAQKGLDTASNLPSKEGGSKLSRSKAKRKCVQKNTVESESDSLNLSSNNESARGKKKAAKRARKGSDVMDENGMLKDVVVLELSDH